MYAHNVLPFERRVSTLICTCLAVQPPSLLDARITTNGFISPPNSSSSNNSSSSSNNTIQPIGSKARHFSGNNLLPSKEQQHAAIYANALANVVEINSTGQSNYLKAPGSERETETNLKKQLAKESNDRSLEALDKFKRKTNNSGSNSLFIVGNSNQQLGLNNGVLSSCSSFVPSLSTGSSVLSSIANTVSPLAQPFYPTSNTVESVVGEFDVET